MKRLSFFLLFLVFTLISKQLYSQSFTVKSSVISLPDFLPVEGAGVSLVGSTITTSTDLHGKFILNSVPKGKYKLQISFIGHKSTSIDIEVKSDTILPIFSLTQSVFNLDETVITSTQSEKSIRKVPVLTQIITSKQIAEMGTTSVEHALEQQVPGLTFSHLLTLTNITLQGMDAKYVLFLIDGERIAGELSGNIDYSRLNTENIEKIEIVKGASSVLYGSQAIGGVINIITKKNKAPFEINLNGRFSKFNEFNGGASISFNKGNFGSSTSLIHNRTDGYNLIPENKYSPTQEKYSNYSISQRLDYNFSSNFNISLNGSYYNYERFDAAEVLTNKHPKYIDYSGGIKANYFFNNKNNIEFSFNTDMYENYNVYKNNIIDSIFKADTTVQNKTITIDSLAQKDKLNNLKILSRISITDNQQLIIGGEYLNEYIFSERVIGKSNQTNDYSLFIQDEMNITNKLNIVGGVRLNMHTELNPHLTPKLAALYKFNQINIRMSYGSGYRTPSLKEKYIEFDHLGWWTNVGNPFLKPEYSTYFSGSVEYTSSFANIISNIYSNKVNNLIGDSLFTDKITKKFIRKYVNISQANIAGIDFISRFKLGYGFYINGSYSYVFSQDKGTKLQLYGTIKNSGLMGIEYRLNKPNYKVTIALQDKITGIKYYAADIPTNPAFSIWRLTVNQNVKSIISLTLGIDNLLNHIETNSFSCISPGRTYFIQLTYNLRRYKTTN